ncbi:acyl-CoA dehydrogenase family protein [Roseovarius sp. B08]|uniref:acyl-CoA dehydrogenase family protein n=1 Tax=Roseovarius sp. B08 TaxID=3449223 RepID=UPI003EDC0A03
MHFQPTDDQKAFRDTAKRFATERLAPTYQERANGHTFDRALIKEMGALGLIGADLPEEFGGLGESSVTSGLIVEEIAYADFNASYVQLLGSLMGGMVAKHASKNIASEWVPKVVSGDAVIGLGLTEPRGGSDAANLILRAEKSGNGWRLNGEKTSMSFASQADAAVVFARTGEPNGGSRGVSAFFVDLNQEGIKRTHFDDIGTKPVGRGSVFFDDVFVPAENMMAEQDRAFGTIMAGFDYSRALIGLECLGAAQASVDETWAYVQEREAFGAPIVQYQGVSFPLAEAETQLTMMRQLCYYTLDLRDRGLPHTSQAAMCKWYLPKTACEILHQCLILHGHYGYTTDLPHHQRYNDVLGLQIGDGTAQIQKLVIAREKVGRLALQYDKKAKGASK